MHSKSILQVFITIILCGIMVTQSIAQTDISSKDLKHKKNTLPLSSVNSNKKTVDLTQIATNKTKVEGNNKTVQPILQHQPDGSIFIKRRDFDAIPTDKRVKIAADKRYIIID